MYKLTLYGLLAYFLFFSIGNNQTRIVAQISNGQKINAIGAPSNLIAKENAEIHEQKEKDCIKIIVFIVALCLLMLVMGILLFRRFQKEKISARKQAFLLQEKIRLLEAQIPKENVDAGQLKTMVQLATTSDPSFFIKFNELDKEFIEKLIQIAPNLIASELELCARLRLCFETKEIARGMGLSIRAIQGKKHRIRKKLGIPMSEDINVWMSRL